MSRAWNRVPARTRLTLLFSALLVTMLVGLGIVALWLVDFALGSNGDELLSDKAGSIAAETDVSRNRLVFDSSELPMIAGLEIVRIWDRDHHLIFSQEGARDIAEPTTDQVEALLNGRTEFSSGRDSGGIPIRLLAEPIVQRGRIIGALEIGRAQADQEAVLGQLRTYGLAGLGLALLLAWLGGHWLAERVFRPITTLAEETERIDAEALSRRLALPSANDELRRLALAFNGMIGRLDAAFVQRKRFSADASHELRGPLAVLRSEIEVALARPRESSYDRAVYERLIDETNRLTRIVENLFALAVADSGRVLTLEPVDIQELVADAGARFAAQAHQRGVHFDLMLDDVLRVAGDGLWLGQLLMNLLENALRHTQPGGTISLTLTAADDCVVISVRDTGEGIAPEHLAHIFERFYRVDKVRSRTTGGAGLGLSICEWVARAHGGSLSVESSPGVGTVMTLRLPALVDAVQQPSQAASRFRLAAKLRSGARESLGELS